MAARLIRLEETCRPLAREDIDRLFGQAEPTAAGEHDFTCVAELLAWLRYKDALDEKEQRCPPA